MMIRRLVASTLVLSAVAVTALPASGQQQQQAVKLTELMRVSIEGVEGKEGVVFTAEIPPGTVSRHSQSGQEFIYVLEGTYVLEPDGGPAKTLEAGDTATHPARRVHTARNPSTTEPARVLVFMLAEKGQPLVTPAQ